MMVGRRWEVDGDRSRIGMARRSMEQQHVYMWIDIERSAL